MSAQENNGQVQNYLNTSGYIQPMNMASTNAYGNYQTPPGVFHTPMQQQFLPQMVNQSSTQQSSPGVSFQQAILDRLDSLDNRLGKLDSIEKQLSNLTKKVTSMESRLSVLETTCTESKLKITELENSRSFDSHILDEVKNKQSHFDDQLKQERAKVESLTDECEKLRSVREDILDLQARSMRDNLLFMGFSRM